MSGVAAVGISTAMFFRLLGVCFLQFTFRFGVANFGISTRRISAVRNDCCRHIQDEKNKEGQIFKFHLKR